MSVHLKTGLLNGFAIIWFGLRRQIDLSTGPVLSFSTLGNALITLFQLFTLDHWYEILNDLVKVADDITAKIYVILWICIGAFIFRNIFAGIMGKCQHNKVTS